MEGLIPFIVRAIKKQNLHSHSYRCLSDGSRWSYHVLGGSGDSFNGSSHRRTQSEFQVPSLFELQPQVDQFVRSRSVSVSNNTSNTSNNNNNNNKGLGHIKHHQNSPASAAYNYNYDYGDKYKFHQY